MKKKKIISQICIHVILVALTAICLLPFLSMISSSFSVTRIGMDLFLVRIFCTPFLKLFFKFASLDARKGAVHRIFAGSAESRRLCSQTKTRRIYGKPLYSAGTEGTTGTMIFGAVFSSSPPSPSSPFGMAEGTYSIRNTRLPLLRLLLKRILFSSI